MTALQFYLGLASISRPLPSLDIPELADHEQWLTEVYIAGLRP